MKYVFLLITCLELSTSAFSQVGIGTTTPNASAALDLTSTTQGLLPPRMTAAQRNAIATPPQGLMVYCTNCGANGEAQVFNGTAWVNVVGGVATSPFACGDPFTFTYNNFTYGTVIGANSKCWLDRNLGASQIATISTDAASYGDLYQWGRGADGHEKITWTNSTSGAPVNGNTSINADIPADPLFITESSSPYDWRINQDNNLWLGVSGVNNPCPSGYRIPTGAELDAERASWISQNVAGAFASPLKLPAVGFRSHWDGLVESYSEGYYWSSSLGLTFLNQSRYLFLDVSNASLGNGFRAIGGSVRCIKD